MPRADGAESVHTTPDLKLSEEAFPTAHAARTSPGPTMPPSESSEDDRGRRRAPRRGRRRATRTRRRRMPRPEAEPDETAEAADEPNIRGHRRRDRAEPTSLVDAPGLARPVAVAITGGIGAGKSTALDAFRAHGAATVSSDEIVHHLLAERRRRPRRARRASRRGRSSATTARSREDRRGRLRRPGEARLARGAPPPARLARVPRVAEQLAELDEPPRVCVTEVPCSSRSARRRGSTRSSSSPRRAPLREQRRRVARDDRDARLLPDREKVRRADYHYVNTGTFEDLVRMGGQGDGDARGGAPTGRREARRARRAARRAAAAAGGVGRSVPSPSGTSGCGTRFATSRSSARTRGTTTCRRPCSPRSSTPRASSTPTPARARARSASCSSCPTRPGDRAPHRRRPVRRRRSLDPEINVRYGSWYLRNLIEPLRRRPRPRSPRTTRGRATSTSGAKGVGIQFPETRDYVDKVLDAQRVYADAYADELTG